MRTTYYMSGRVLVSTPNVNCPVTETAGSTVRRRDIAGFSLTEVVYAEGTSLARHSHSHCYLAMVLSGSYSEKHSHKEFQWSEGALHLLPAGERHENHFQSTRLLLVKIQPEAIKNWSDDHARFLSEPREITGALSSWLANRMIREFQSDDDLAPLAIEGVLLEMLAESARSCNEEYGSTAPSWLKRVREVLQESFVQAPGLAILAGIAGVHPVHLSREFHRHYRTTIGGFVRQRRIERASELLSKSELSLADIANACGFSDQSHFCALFKKHSGMTPAKFRKLSADVARQPSDLVQAR
jgi:AraC family transcriptional regulator